MTDAGTHHAPLEIILQTRILYLVGAHVFVREGLA